MENQILAEVLMLLLAAVVIRKRLHTEPPGPSLMTMHNPPHPREFIRETYIEPFDISIRSLAESLGVAASTLARVVSRRSAVSPEEEWAPSWGPFSFLS